MQAVHIGSHPGQCDVYHMPVINICSREMCILSTLIFEILPSCTVPRPSLCMIFHYGGGPWPPTKINQSPACHCAKTWWISYPLWVSLITSWQVRVFGHYLHSLMLKTQWLKSLEAKFLTGWWEAIYWQMIVAAKMLGKPLSVDCWRPGIWWDSWCSSRCHCYGWVCRYWCQCCEWAWQY